MKYFIFLTTILIHTIQSIQILNNSTDKNITDQFDVWKYTKNLEINMGFWASFSQSLIIVFISEIADKTFIIVLLFSSASSLLSGLS